MTQPTGDIPLRVLSTLNEDGSRRWLRPRVSRGRFWRARRITAYALMGVFTLLPYLRLGGKPLVLLDVVRREFTLFGYTFLPTDTRLLALLLISVFVSVFLLTALFGRVWCGWACPQTVYLEFVYRPIERLFDGDPGRKQSITGRFRPVKFVVYLLVSMFLAHTFLAYFVGVDRLRLWIFGSPLDHPAAFLAMAGVTGLMLFDFGYFREQTCLIACPYGRLQSALLDRQSLIISYDAARGEPRGRMARGPQPEGASPRGDCIDCRLCVSTCPTGIDIREGLQMECVACAQCIDACDDVMARIGRPTGLIRYSSQAAIAGSRPRLMRPRVIAYPLALAALLGALAWSLATKSPMDVSLLRFGGLPFNVLPSGEVTNHLTIKIANRTSREGLFRVELTGLPGARVELEENPVRVGAGERRTLSALVATPAEAIGPEGHVDVRVSVTDERDGATVRPKYRLLGPVRTTARKENTP